MLRYGVINSHLRRQLAEAALAKVQGGAVAATVETELVDFKEESGTRGAGGIRVPIPPNHEPAAVALAAEVACLANGDNGGVLVVGVDDRGSGPTAFVGAHLDPRWLRRRIHELTQPSYTVQVEPITIAGVGLYLVDVPPALEFIRSGGKLRTRVGTACVELTGDRAASLMDQRRGFDWSAQPSGWRFRQISPSAMLSAKRKYQAARGLVPDSDLELCRRLGVLVVVPDQQVSDTHADPADPELTNAGAVLLCASDPDVEQIVALVGPAEGLPSTASVRGPAPMLDRFDEVWHLMTTTAFPPSSSVIGGSRRLIRALPDAALRETIVNAIMHRDYRLPLRSIVVQALGANTAKVRSPGGFVSGVNADRLITSPSVTRNPMLAGAMRSLGLAEREGVGVDTMYAQMLRAGHGSPVIVDDAGDVLVSLRGGAPDVMLVTFFEELAVQDPALDDVRAAMAVTSLLVRTPLRADQLAHQAQCTVDEAHDTLERLETAGVVTRLVNRSRAFQFSPTTRHRFTGRTRYPTRRRSEEHLDLIRAYLDTAPEIGRADAAALLAVAPNTASRILSDLARDGFLEAVANTRGRGVRYRGPITSAPRGRNRPAPAESDTD